jgi:hypothetical protein
LVGEILGFFKRWFFVGLVLLKLDFKDSYLTIEPAFDLDFDLLEIELFRANIYKFESFVDYLLYFYVLFSFRRAELS